MPDNSKTQRTAVNFKNADEIVSINVQVPVKALPGLLEHVKRVSSQPSVREWVFDPKKRTLVKAKQEPKVLDPRIPLLASTYHRIVTLDYGAGLKPEHAFFQRIVSTAANTIRHPYADRLAIVFGPNNVPYVHAIPSGKLAELIGKTFYMVPAGHVVAVHKSYVTSFLQPTIPGWHYVLPKKVRGIWSHGILMRCAPGASGPVENLRHIPYVVDVIPAMISDLTQAFGPTWQPAGVHWKILMMPLTDDTALGIRYLTMSAVQCREKGLI